MSSKNILQELFQKRRAPLPTYSSWCSGPPHNPAWSATVTANDRTFQSDECSSKIAAECNAADKALAAIKTERTAKLASSGITHDIRVLIMIDIENLPALAGQLVEEVDLAAIHTVSVLGFVGHNHPFHNKLWRGIRSIVVRSSQADAVDSAMQVYAGVAMAKNLYDLYVVATMDRFSLALRDAITRPPTANSSDVDMPIWPAVACVIVTRVEDLIKAVREPDSVM